jgi:hypothetical protein
MGIFGNLFKPQPPTEAEAQRSASLMEQLKKRRGEETGRWLNMMSRDTRNVQTSGPAPTAADVDSRPVLNEAPYTPPVNAQYATMSMPVVRVPENQPLANSAAVVWINKLFQEFAIQSSAFNSSAQGTHLVINVHAPEFEFEKPQLDTFTTERKVSLFKGHLATLQWGMLVQGNENKIDVYVVPAEQILDYMVHQVGSSFTPFMTIDSRDVEHTKEWHIGGTTITYDAIPLLAKELLGDLIRIASGSMNESELFSEHAHGLKLGETVAQGFARPVPPLPPAALDPVDSRFTATGANAENIGTIKSLATWTVASQFISTVDQDLLWLAQQKADAENGGNKVAVQQLNGLITKLRTLSGEIGQLTADYKPSSSKYNAS